MTDPEYFALGRDPELLVTLMGLKRYCHRGKSYCWPSLGTLAKELHVHPGTIRTRLRQLQSQGYIRIRRKSRRNEYHLIPLAEVPFPLDSARQDALFPPKPISRIVPVGTGEQRVSACTNSACQHAPKQIKGTRSKNNNKLLTPAPEPAANPTRDVVVAQKIDPEIEARLKSARVPLTRVVIATVHQYPSESIQQALACLEAGKKVDNPAGYFIAALKAGWSPPASFVEARERKARERAELRARIEQEISDRSHLLEQPRTAADLEREVEDRLAAEEEMRSSLLKKAPRQADALAERRAEIRLQVQQQWQNEESQTHRRIEMLYFELERLKGPAPAPGGQHEPVTVLR